MSGLSKETRIQILQFLWDAEKESPTRIVRGNELMESLQIDEYTLVSNLRLLSDLKWIRLLSASLDARAYIKVTESGLRQIEIISSG
jgi:DNA-binding MarR family transcriptional regulator